MERLEQLQNYLSVLEGRHSKLDESINELYEKKGSDFIIENLKKQKLSIKDQMVRVNKEIEQLKD